MKDNTKLYKRDIFDAIAAEIGSSYILIITGSRRAGKTSLLKLLQQKIIAETTAPGNILFYDLENPVLRESFDNNNYDLVAQYLISQAADPNKRIFVFLDEVQYLDKPSGLLKYLHDHYENLKFIVSGSSSLRIKEIFSDSMVGRKRTYRLFPLNLREFLLFQEKAHLLRLLPKIDLFDKNCTEIIQSLNLLNVTRQELLTIINEFLIFGGFPEPTLLPDADEKKTALFEYYGSYIQKDISYLFSISNIAKFNKLSKLYASQIGNLVNFTEISNTLGMSRQTIERYSFLQESTFFLTFLPPFHTNIRKELTRMPKVYFEDIGVRNAVLNNVGRQAVEINPGPLAENYVFNQLCKHHGQASIYFWRTTTGQETDFVLEQQQQLIPIEVKFREMKKAALPSGLRGFIRQYAPEKAIVVTKNFLHVDTFQKTTILYLPIYLI